MRQVVQVSYNPASSIVPLLIQIETLLKKNSSNHHFLSFLPLPFFFFYLQNLHNLHRYSSITFLLSSITLLAC